jgi:uncharacterized protein YjeT (DUF2065 family)
VNKWNLLLAAIGLAMAIEGLPYFVSPRGVRRLLHALDRTGERALRMLGLFWIATGLWICYFATR